MTLLSNRTKMMLLTGIVCLFAAGTAAAQSNPATCTNDIDCAANPACGGDVCDWNSATHVCKAAGSAALDGWCTTTDDCKCKDLGATCVSAYCTFTRPCGAPDAGGCATGGTGGGTGTAGTGGGGGGDSGGCNVAATTPTAASALFVAIGLLVFARRRQN